MTNFDMIKNMSMIELAEVFYCWISPFLVDPIEEKREIMKDIMDFLKEEVEKKEHLN